MHTLNVEGSEVIEFPKAPAMGSEICELSEVELEGVAGGIAPVAVVVVPFIAGMLLGAAAVGAGIYIGNKISEHLNADHSGQ